MHGEHWVTRYRTIFFFSLILWLLIRLYLLVDAASFFLQGLTDGWFDAYSIAIHLETATWAIALASGAAILISLAVHAYERLDAATREHEGSPDD